MNSQTSLFQAGNFNLKLKHFAIIAVLVLAFSTSFLIRTQGGDYGFELNEFDPFFNFRATEYIVENGFSEYFEWTDDKSWYPYGRDVSSTSQFMLHATAAISYQIFGGNSSLYDFTVLFPVVIGSLTVVVIFALVRLFGGTFAGLLATLLFSVSVPILLRGSIGWFKSEPLGIFYAILGLYLFLSGIKSDNSKIAVSKIILAGVTLAFAMSSWGGNQFFIIPIGLFILTLPFIRKDHKFLAWTIPLFVAVFVLISSLFERPGLTFVYSLGGLSLVIPTIFLLTCIFIQKISNDKNKIRNSLFLLLSVIIVGSFLVVLGDELNFLSLPSFRYLNAINPFLTTLDPLTDSVAEHATTNIQTSFFLHSIFMIFGGIGIWFILSKKISQNNIFMQNDMKAFVLIIGITGIYVSSAFVRLEVFASISLIIFASIGLSILTREIFQIKYSEKKNYFLKISFVIIIIILFIIPLVFPTNTNWINTLDFPPTILTGGTQYPPSTDWLETLEWIKMNTPENSVVMSWWDYGYWISTMAERATISDNATLIDHRIKKTAEIFLSSPDDAWNMLKEMNVDYVVVFIAAQKLDASIDNNLLYVLGGGGDVAKSPWFIRIAEEPLEKYIHNDDRTKNNNFWNNTLLGKMIPFSTILFYNEYTKQQSNEYQYGFAPISIKNIKYQNSESDPLFLVYASPDFYDETPNGTMTGVFVYEINKNYSPENLQ